MKKNVIILTGGLSGSSVLAGLIAAKGYWLGEETKEIKRYSTNENSRLVDLNIEIFKRSGYGWDDALEIPPPSISDIEAVAAYPDLEPFNHFVNECNGHSPWLWKDPRLCYTIFFWKHFLDLNNCQVILMSRSVQQAWTGAVLKGKIPIAFNDLQTIENNCIRHSEAFCKQEQITPIRVTFEELIVNPEETLSRINTFLDSDLSIQDFTSIYKGPIHQTRWSKVDFRKAQFKLAYYKYLKRDTIVFPRKKEGAGSGFRHKKI